MEKTRMKLLIIILKEKTTLKIYQVCISKIFHERLLNNQNVLYFTNNILFFCILLIICTIYKNLFLYVCSLLFPLIVIKKLRIFIKVLKHFINLVSNYKNITE